MVTQLIASSLIAILLIIAGPARADGERNHMAETANPYLHLHATDPVNWRPWNAESLAEAKKLGKPILLSIGYLSCHWCHVMQRESYAIEATAKLINDNFLPILVDREEMPELDATFQSAAALMGLGGGWPLTMFLTPGGKPFYGGTYFPPQETGEPQDALRRTTIPPPPASLVATASSTRPNVVDTNPAGPNAPTPTRYGDLPWYRRSRNMSLLTAAAFVTWFLGYGAILCIPVCIALVSGDIYLEQTHPDGSLKKWGWPNKVAAFAILALNILPLLSLFLRR